MEQHVGAENVKRFSRTFYSLSIVGCTVLMYAALVVLSAGCALAHADQTQAHHHHSEESSSSQSAFCAWACQATSDIASVAEPSMAVVLFLPFQPYFILERLQSLPFSRVDKDHEGRTRSR